MIFNHILQSFIAGVILILFLLSPTMDSNWAPSMDGEPFMPKKYHKLYYFFLSILYVASIVYFLTQNEIESLIGLGLTGFLCLFIIFLRMVFSSKNRKKALTEKNELHKEIDNKFDFSESKFIAASTIFWFLIWIGTYVKWQGYSYYSFLKIIAIIIAIGMMEVSYELSKPFFIIFIAIGIIFNPFMPFKFDRLTWQAFDIITLIILVLFYFKVRYFEKRSNST